LLIGILYSWLSTARTKSSASQVSRSMKKCCVKTFLTGVSKEPVTPREPDSSPTTSRRDLSSPSPNSPSVRNNRSQATTPVKPKSFALDPKALEFMPSKSATNGDELDNDVRSRILSSTYSSSSDEESEDEDPNVVYVATKMKMLDLTKSLKGKKTPELERLEAKLKKAESEYRFDKKRAESTLKAERQKDEFKELQDRLRGVPEEKESKADAPAVPANGEAPASSSIQPNGEPACAKTDVPPAQNTPSTPSRSRQVTESTTPESGDEEGGIFGGLLDESSEAPASEENANVTVRDMSLPRHYSGMSNGFAEINRQTHLTPLLSGKTPKSLLEDAVRRQDKFASINYKLLTRTRVFRAAVSIRWEGGKEDTFRMEEDAVRDETQAINYAAILALFSIGTTQSHRQLPPVFRELWDELEAKKKETDDREYRERLKFFKGLADARLQVVAVVSEDTTSPTSLPLFPSISNDECRNRKI
jgi:ATP-dependent RNA helicase DHX29